VVSAAAAILSGRAARSPASAAPTLSRPLLLLPAPPTRPAVATAATALATPAGAAPRRPPLDGPVGMAAPRGLFAMYP